jgi:plasmid stability protein
MNTATKQQHKVAPIAVNIPLPRDLHRQVRVRAAEKGITLKAAVIEALTDWTHK